jgi:prepilin-type N-terminal cleavage/methylation domain-containing protein
MKGFTLIEIIIVVVILAVLTAMALTSFSSFRQNQTLNSDTNKIVSVINEARSKTLSSQDFSQYGVHMESSRVILFKGAVYPSGGISTTTLSAILEISGISLNGGGSDIVFQKITGKTDQYGTLIIRVKADASKTKTINISSTGITNAQ